MKTGFLFVGFLFFINPDLITFDPLPDVIGYLFFAKGLSRLSHLEERVAVARKYALLLALVSGLKLLSVPSVFSARFESDRLMVSFFFLVAELSLSLLMAHNAFQGIHYLAVRRNGDLALKGFEVARTYLTGFFIVKPIIHFLPQLATLIFSKIDEDPDAVENAAQLMRNWSATRSVLFLLGSIVLIVLGIYAARVLWAYRARCRSDLVFSQNLLEDYRKSILEDESMQARLAIRSAFRAFLLAAVLLADVFFDNAAVIPKFLIPLLVLYGLRRLSQKRSVGRGVHVFVWCSSALLLAAQVYRLIRLHGSDGHFSETFPADALSLVFGVVSSLVLAVCVFWMLRAVAQTALSYTQYAYAPYRIALSVATSLILVLSAVQYAYPSWFALVAVGQWVLWLVALYFHKKSMDEISSEAEYRLM